MEQKAKCENIHEPRPKYHWSGGVPRLKLFELPNVYMPYCCDSNYDEYINYFSKISTLCEEIGSPNVFIVGTSMLALITILVYCYPNSAWNMN